MADTGPRAAVDVGTNSIRLLILDADGARVTREMVITRLGQGVDRTGVLDQEALHRTLDTLRGYRDRWVAAGVDTRVRIAATSAVRDAANRHEFFDGVRALTGVEAEVLSGEQEAALAYLGATSAIALDDPPAVLDIGGGSTELIVGGEEGVSGAISLQLGSVRLTERLLPSDPPTADEIEAATAEVMAQLDLADRTLRDAGAPLTGARPLIGTAGTVTTVAALYLDLDDYLEDEIHGTRVPAAAVGRVSADLLAMTVAERRRLGPMAAGREDVIGGGALILRAVVDRFGFDEVIVSESDILDGLALTAGTGDSVGDPDVNGRAR